MHGFSSLIDTRRSLPRSQCPRSKHGLRVRIPPAVRCFMTDTVTALVANRILGLIGLIAARSLAERARAGWSTAVEPSKELLYATTKHEPADD
jgi:hypothetical protein